MILLIISALCAFLCIPAYKLWNKKENLSMIFWIWGICGVIIIGICGPGCMAEQSNSMTQKYRDQWSSKYTGLEQRIENWENGDHTDATLWSDVQKYNDDLIDAAKNNDQNGLLSSWLSDAYGVDAISFDFELIKCEDDFDDDIVNIEE